MAVLFSKSTMGFFKRMLGGAGDPPAAPAAGVSAGDPGAGKPLTSFDIEAGPFPKQMRVRAANNGYALFGRWIVVTLNSPDEWTKVKEDVLHAYYKQFGLYSLPDGNQTIRWNETTWRAIRDELQIVFDPNHASGA